MEETQFVDKFIKKIQNLDDPIKQYVELAQTILKINKSILKIEEGPGDYDRDNYQRSDEYEEDFEKRMEIKEADEKDYINSLKRLQNKKVC